MSVYPYPEFEGRSVFISGGSSGINLEIARAFGNSGARVAIQGRSETRIATALAALRALDIDCEGYAADVRDYDATRAAIKAAAVRFGPLGVVIAGAAGNFTAPAAEMSSTGFQSVVAIDLLGTFNVLRAACDLPAPDGVSMIAISAPQATVAYARQAHVNAAKAGVNHLIRSLAVEWGEHGIRVNAIVPGPIADTEGMRRLAATATQRSRIERSVPLRRYGRKAEVAELALFLASRRATYITGAIIPCDGGLSLMGPEVFAPDRKATQHDALNPRYCEALPGGSGKEMNP